MPHCFRFLVFFLVSLSTVAMVPSAGLAQDASVPDAKEQARNHYQTGATQFAKGDYTAAISSFAAANALVPAALLEFNIALCYDRLNDKPEALRRYRLYLKQAPNAENRAVVESKILRLEGELREAAPPAQPTTIPASDPVDASVGGASSEVTAQEPSVGLVGGNVKEAPGKEPADAVHPEFARVAAINIDQVRDEASASNAPVSSELQSQSAPPAPPATPEDTPKSETPVYKKWWFWAVVGVGVIVVIDWASTPETSSTPTSAGMEPGVDSAGFRWQF